EYGRALAAHEDDPPRMIRTPEQSGVPAMQQALAAAIAERRDEAIRLRTEAVEVFDAQVRSLLELLRAQWVGSGHTEEEIRELTQDLEPVLAPLRKEFLV